MRRRMPRVSTHWRPKEAITVDGGLNPGEEGYDEAEEAQKNYPGGALRTAAALRLAEWEAYKSETENAEGEHTLAAAEKLAADAAVKARETVTDADDNVTETVGSGGDLVEALATKKGEWEAAKEDFTEAKEALSGALGDTTLEALR